MQNELNRDLHNRTTEVYQRLKKLDSRLGRVTINICGHTPEVASDIPKAIDEHLHEKFDGITRVITSMEDELSRLENSVGSSQPTSQPMAKSAAGY